MYYTRSNAGTPQGPVGGGSTIFIHVHWVIDAIQPSHPLSSPSSPVFNLSQPQGLFQWVISSYHVTKILELQLQRTSFQWVIQGWFPLWLTDLISLLSKGLSRVFQHHSSKASILQHSAFFMTQLSRPYITTENKHSFDYMDICHKVMSLLFNMLSRFVKAFLPRSKHLLISWLQSQSAVILEPKKIKSIAVSIFSPSLCHEVMGLDAMILVFFILSFKLAFLLSFAFIKRLFSSSLLSAV